MSSNNLFGNSGGGGGGGGNSQLIMIAVLGCCCVSCLLLGWFAYTQGWFDNLLSMFNGDGDSNNDPPADAGSGDDGGGDDGGGDDGGGDDDGGDDGGGDDDGGDDGGENDPDCVKSGDCINNTNRIWVCPRPWDAKDQGYQYIKYGVKDERPRCCKSEGSHWNARSSCPASDDALKLNPKAKQSAADKIHKLVKGEYGGKVDGPLRDENCNGKKSIVFNVKGGKGKVCFNKTSGSSTEYNTDDAGKDTAPPAAPNPPAASHTKQPDPTTKWGCWSIGNARWPTKKLGEVSIWWGNQNGDGKWACNNWVPACKPDKCNADLIWKKP